MHHRCFSVPFSQGFSFPVVAFGVEMSCHVTPPVYSAKNQRGRSSFASGFCLYLKGVAVDLTVWVGNLTEDWSDQDLGWLPQRSSNLKLACAPPNGTVAVWECPVSLTALWSFSSFLAKWMEIGKQPEGLQNTDSLRYLNSWMSISFPPLFLSLFSFLSRAGGFLHDCGTSFFMVFASWLCVKVETKTSKMANIFIFRWFWFYFMCTKINQTLVRLTCSV